MGASQVHNVTIDEQNATGQPAGPAGNIWSMLAAEALCPMVDTWGGTPEGWGATWM